MTVRGRRSKSAPSDALSIAKMNKTKVKADEPHPRKAANKLTLHSLSPVQSKFHSSLPEGKLTSEDCELARLTSMVKNNFLAEARQDTLLRKIMPKYRPNSKAKSLTSQFAFKDLPNVRHNGGQLQPLKTSQSEADQSNNCPTVATKAVRGGSCVKINTNFPPSNKSKTSRSKSTSKKGPKVKFCKKVTVHFVPSDEERGCFEWRKNLTRQGIYEAMMWKSELAKLEKDEQDEFDQLITRTSNSPEALASYGLD